MLGFLRRKRVVLNKVTFVHGETFSPGALAFQPVASVADPVFYSNLNPARNFHTLAIGQPPPVWQGYAIPRGGNPGDVYNVQPPSGLLHLGEAYDYSERIPDNVYG